jgi:hypothetical protein
MEEISLNMEEKLLKIEERALNSRIDRKKISYEY